MKRSLIIAALLGTSIVAPAFATSLTADTSIIQTPGIFGTPRGTPITDSESSPSGSVLAKSDIGEPFGPTYYGTGYAYGRAGDGGFPDEVRQSAVAVGAKMFDDSELWEFESLVTTSHTVTNDSGADRIYLYNLCVDELDLGMEHFPTASSGSAFMSFEFELLIGGVSQLSLSASLEGGDFNTAVLTTGGSMGTPTLRQDTIYPDTEYGYVFAPISDAISLGTLAHGESVTIETRMRGYMSIAGEALGGGVSGGRYQGYVESAPSGTPPVPEPASVLLLGMGCLGLAGRRLRTHR